MAKATIECTCPECGAKHAWSVTCYNRREADNWEQYHANDTDRLCPACYAKQQAAKRAEAREAENKAAAEKAGVIGLPELSGSEKQIAWANTIRQKALDSALMESAGRTSAGMTDKGRAFVAGVIAKMSAEAKWWIDHRNDAAHLVCEEIECANWARLDDATRAAHMDKLHAKAESHSGGRLAIFALAELHSYERYERARLAGRGSMEQRHADEDAKRAALPAKPATLAERVGKPGARWNGKFYGRDGLRVYLDGNEVQVPADVKAAWNAEWTEYNAAKKAAGIA
jgi:predicted Fe-S protein YdhL (DUF1289 family)